MKRYVLFIPFLSLLLTAFPAFAEIRAEIVDLDGTVSVSRNGAFLEEDEIDFGTEILAYDMIQTGPTGYVEILIETPVSPEVSVKVMENTTLFMEHAVHKQVPQTSLNLYRGAVRTKAEALLQGAQLNIRTDSSVMGVRGTVFSVVTAPDDSLLVTCREGKVLCSTEGETDAFIRPGAVYETHEKEGVLVKELPPGEIDAYISDWQQLRREALMINGALSLEHYAGLYLRHAPGFLETFDELEAKQEVFRRWQRIIERGETLSMGEATKDKIALSNGIIRLRSRMPMMEHVYYTLYDLTALADWSETVRNGLSETTSRTLQIYRRRREEFQRKLTLARYYFRIFLEIDKQASGQGLMPSSDLMGDFLLEEPLFGAPPQPAGPPGGAF